MKLVPCCGFRTGREKKKNLEHPCTARVGRIWRLNRAVGGFGCGRVFACPRSDDGGNYALSRRPRRAPHPSGGAFRSASRSHRTFWRRIRTGSLQRSLPALRLSSHVIATRHLRRFRSPVSDASQPSRTRLVAIAHWSRACRPAVPVARGTFTQNIPLLPNPLTIPVFHLITVCRDCRAFLVNRLAWPRSLITFSIPIPCSTIPLRRRSPVTPRSYSRPSAGQSGGRPRGFRGRHSATGFPVRLVFIPRVPRPPRREFNGIDWSETFFSCVDPGGRIGSRRRIRKHSDSRGPAPDGRFRFSQTTLDLMVCRCVLPECTLSAPSVGRFRLRRVALGLHPRTPRQLVRPDVRRFRFRGFMQDTQRSGLNPDPPDDLG